MYNEMPFTEKWGEAPLRITEGEMMPPTGDGVAEEAVEDANTLLERADESFDEKGWCPGYLVDTQGAHCSLGAIGYARWGEAYDRLVLQGETIPGADESWHKGSSGYSVLVMDASTRAAMRALAAQLGQPPYTPDPIRQAGEDVQTIMGWNDTNNAFRVRLRFRSAVDSLKGRIMSLIKKMAPKPAPRVEYIPADNVVPSVETEMEETL